jgi:uncharacterized Ntn-hydrolase superfamily protein
VRPCGPLISTFSIVGFDPSNGDLGVAVATKYIAVGSSVPNARPQIGAIAVQAYANPVLAPRGLALLDEGKTPGEVVDLLMAEDEGRDYRQLGIVDAQGQAVSYTGVKCEAWAGGMVGLHCAAQGNMLLGEQTVQAMIDWFTTHDGPLADRLVDALRAGEQAGGDKRGRQSSALLVVRPGQGFRVYDDSLVDLRVDSDPSPCLRLRNLLNEYYQVQLRTPAEEYLPLTEQMVKDIQLALYRLGRYANEFHGQFDAATRSALWAFCVAENQKDRWADDGTIDPRLFSFLVGFADRARQ